VALKIANSDRVASKVGVFVTLSFTTATLLPIGGRITFSFPCNFFATSTVPTFVSSNVTGLMLTITTMSSYLVALTSGVFIGGSVPASIIFSNFQMGPNPLPDSATGIQVSTSSDTIASDGAASGIIGNFTQVRNVSLTIADKDRVSGSAGISVTLSFVPASSILPGGFITLTYPSGFFCPWHYTQCEWCRKFQRDGPWSCFFCV